MYLFTKLHANDQTSDMWHALRRSSQDSSLSSHVAFQRNMKLLSHWGKSKSCSAAVLWAALCSIALETGLIGMCGPNSPHCLKLAGFMFTTIGFGIAALDCLCFAVRVCMQHQECKANSSLPSSIILECMTLVIGWYLLKPMASTAYFYKLVGGCGLLNKWWDLGWTISGSFHLTERISAF